MKKTVKYSLLAMGCTVALFVAICIFNIFLDSRYPLRHELTNNEILVGSQKLYQRPTGDYYDPAPGNDSYLAAIYQLSQSAPDFLEASQPLAVCKTDAHGCTVNPVWRPRSAFFLNNEPSFTVAGLSNQITAQYKSMAEDPSTTCTGYNVTHKDEALYKKPNYKLLCYDKRLRLVSYEYVSDSDSTYAK